MFLCHKYITARCLCNSEPDPTAARIIPLSYRHFKSDPPRFLICNDEELDWLREVLNGEVDFLSNVDLKELSIYDQAD